MTSFRHQETECHQTTLVSVTSIRHYHHLAAASEIYVIEAMMALNDAN